MKICSCLDQSGRRELTDTDFVEAHSFAKVQDEYLASLGILLK